MSKIAFTSIALALLPTGWVSSELKMHLGLLINELMHDGNYNKIFGKFRLCRGNVVTIQSTTDSGVYNPIYFKFHDYIINTYASKIVSYELVPKRGDIEFNLTESVFQNFVEMYDGHKIEIKISATGDSKFKHEIGKKVFTLKSKTANSTDIKEFVKSKIETRKRVNNVITIWRSVVEASRKKDVPANADWDCLSIKTNKNLSNTIYSESVIKELFDDFDKFMKNESWYAQKGVPYKRGYFLVGPPGTGKSSVSKILANIYDIPVFCLDLSIITDNAMLIKLIAGISYRVNNTKHILLLEDIDRISFFSPDRHYIPGNKSTVDMSCLLNMLDGVAEPYGRIVIMTANNPEHILSLDALMRPGRIDKVVEIGHCTKTQVQKMFELFHSVDEHKVDWEALELRNTITASSVIGLLLENIDKPDAFIKVIDKHVDKEKLDPELITKIKETEDQAKKNEDDADGQPGRRRFLRSNRRYTQYNQLSDKQKIRRNKSNAKFFEKRVIAMANKKIKAEAKAKKLTETLFKAEQKRKAAILKKKEAAKAIENDSEEDELDTPAFLLNSIPLDEVSNKAAIFTYELNSESRLDPLDGFAELFDK